MQSLSRLIVLLGMVALPVWAAQTIDDDLYALQLDYQRAEASQKEATRRVTQTAQEKATADVRLTDAQLIAQRAADTHATAQAAEQAALRDLGAARTRLEAAWQAKQQSASRTVGF